MARSTARTDQIPAPRPRKPLPQRAVTWLVLKREGEILLEKRPSPGIWGGLWSFPEAAKTDVARYCLQSLGCEIAAPRNLDALEHGFTHFRLLIRPLLCDVTRRSLKAQSPGRLWMSLESAAGAAVPAPVRKLVARLVA